MKGKYLLSYGPDQAEQPILWTLVKTYDVKINILRAEIGAAERGTMLVELEAPDDSLAAAFGWLDSIGIERMPLARELRFREADCVHCGACTGVCFSGALILDQVTALLSLDDSKCIACGLCVKACPFGLFELEFGEA